MEGFASIGAVYSIPNPKKYGKSFYCRVIENDFNRNISILEVIEYCPERGKKYEVDSKILYTCSGLGIILPPDGDIVIENGREYVKPREEIKEISKTLKLKK